MSRGSGAEAQAAISALAVRFIEDLGSLVGDPDMRSEDGRELVARTACRALEILIVHRGARFVGRN